MLTLSRLFVLISLPTSTIYCSTSNIKWNYCQALITQNCFYMKCHLSLRWKNYLMSSFLLREKLKLQNLISLLEFSNINFTSFWIALPFNEFLRFIYEMCRHQNHLINFLSLKRRKRTNTIWSFTSLRQRFHFTTDNKRWQEETQFTLNSFTWKICK